MKTGDLETTKLNLLWYFCQYNPDSATVCADR